MAPSHGYRKLSELITFGLETANIFYRLAENTPDSLRMISASNSPAFPSTQASTIQEMAMN